MKLNAAQTMFLLNHAFVTEKRPDMIYKGNRRGVAEALERRGCLVVRDVQTGSRQFTVELTPVGKVVTADLVSQFDRDHPPARELSDV